MPRHLTLAATTAILLLATTACGGGPTEPTPTPPRPPTPVQPPVPPTPPTPPEPPAPPAPVWNLSVGGGICTLPNRSWPSAVRAHSDTLPLNGLVFNVRVDSAGVRLHGVPVEWVSRDSSVYLPRPGGTDTAGRVGRTWLVAEAHGARDSVPVWVVDDVMNDCDG